MDMPGFEFLQAWYSGECNGDWEHQFGVSIETLDNPGWSLKVDLEKTNLHGRTLARQVLERSEHDWLQVWSDGNRFNAAAGPGNLAEAVEAFRAFVEQTD